MKDKIIAKLQDLERVHGFKILLAVESGSRAWGMESKNSDYDIRVVYYYDPEKYYDLAPYAQDFGLIEGDFDISCMEMRKFTTLLMNSNPTCVEWLQSPILYIGEVPKVFKDFITKDINLMSLAHHYKGLARQNYHKYLENNKDTSAKRYLYALKGMLAGHFAICGQLPPIDMKLMCSLCPMNSADRLTVMKLIALKLNSPEITDIGDHPELKKIICDFINLEIPLKKRKAFDTRPYREFIMGTIRNGSTNHDYSCEGQMCWCASRKKKELAK